MTEITIPEFSSMTTEELHAWEFSVYDQVPGDGDLRDIIGDEAAARYYAERGRRVDLKYLDELIDRAEELAREMASASVRLKEGTSGQYYYPDQFPPPVQ